MTAMIALVCSARPRPSVATNRPLKTGESKWGRDVHHASIDRLRTLCGRDCGEYLLIEKTTPEEALEDPTHSLCMGCTRKLHELT